MLSILNFQILIIGIVILANIVLGTIIFFHNRRSVTGLLFLLFTLVSSLWGIFNYLSYYLLNTFWLLWNMRLVMFFAIYQAFLFFLLIFVFPKREVKFPKYIVFGLFPLVYIVSLLTLTPYLFSGVRIVEGSPQPVVEPGIIFFALTAVSLVASGIFMMVGKLKMADPKTKSQFQILLIGLMLMFLTIILFNFIFPIIFNITSFIPIGAVFVSPFIICTFYSIYKHELLNARVVATEILTFAIIILNFIGLIFSENIFNLVFRGGLFITLLIFGFLFIRATTKEVDNERQLRDLTSRLKVIDKQKDEFISMAAHELRAPMTAVKGYISMILEGDTGDIPEKARGFLADANNINERLIRLVNNMLNVSRIEEGKMVYQIEDENLSHFVRSVYSQFIPEAERKGLDYKLEIPLHIKDKVRVDPDRIQEVIGNLISNAVKYTDSGSIKVRLVQRREGYVRFEVIDTGPGISKEEQAKLFQKFQRVETNVGKTTGSGLGLYICKLLVEKFSGKIGVESEPGKGSKFWFELPLIK